MAIQYIIHYSFIDEDGTVRPNEKTPPILNKDEANSLWVLMKNDPRFQNLVPEKIAPKRRVVGVEYSHKGKVYTFETNIAVKKGNWVVVEREYIDNYTGKPIKEKVVVQAVTDDHEEEEEEIEKRFPLTQLKKIFGIVKTK